MTTQAMLMFSLGSVQAFISQARKTRDLWLGSYLYSALMEAAMWKMAVIDPEKNIHEGIVFPSETRLIRRLHEDDYRDDESFKKNIPELPNKYVAIFENADRARDFAKQSADQVKECWEKICKAVWDDIILASGVPNLNNVLSTWERQTEDMGAIFEIFWVVVEGDPDNYSQWLESTEKALNARKLVRNFAAQSEAGEKSTISGEREALSRSEKGKPAHSRQEVRRFWQELSGKLVEKRSNRKKIASPLDISTDGSERLDAIDTIKRFAMLTDTPRTKDGQRIIPEQPFPTVSTIATASFVHNLLSQLKGEDTDKRLIKALEDWELNTRDPLDSVSRKAIPALYILAKKQKPAGNIKHIEDILRRDGDCFMPETFRFQRLQKDYDIKDVAQAQNLADKGGKALKALLEVTDDLKIPRPRPYYAILQMDGDGMGKIMKGVDNLKEHQGISSAMAGFARNQVPLIVEKEYFGRLVYAGGDDVLAFSTLKNLLKLGDTLQSTYRKSMLDELKDHLNPPKAVSASMGIAIAHTYAPLSYVLRCSREAESSAKHHYGRNALVVAILRRSGQQTRVGCKWSYEELDKDAQPITLFQHFSSLFEDDVLSPKCIHLLLEESPSLVKMPIDAQASEVKRIFKRQSSNDPQHKQRVEHLDQDAWHLVKLAQAMEEKTCREIYFNAHPNEEDEGQSLPPGEIEANRQKLALDLHSDEHRRGLVETLGWLLVMEFLDRKRELS